MAVTCPESTRDRRAVAVGRLARTRTRCRDVLYGLSSRRAAGSSNIEIRATHEPLTWNLVSVDVRFGRCDEGGSFAVIDRPDGVRLRLWSYDRKFAVPHDIAHFVAERVFGLDGGVWGSIAAGAVLESMEVLSGRLRHDRRARSEAVLRRNRDQIGLAEVLADVVHRGLDQDERMIGRNLREAWGVFRADPCPFPASQAVEAVAELRGIGEKWLKLPPDALLPLRWRIDGARAGSRGYTS